MDAVTAAIGVRIPQCFFRMASGKCCSYMSIEFAVRQIISGKDTITADFFHADNEIHSLPDQVCKGIKTFVTTVCHKDGIITILMKTIRTWVDMHVENLDSDKMICYPVIQGERINYQNK